MLTKTPWGLSSTSRFQLRAVRATTLEEKGDGFRAWAMRGCSSSSSSRAAAAATPRESRRSMMRNKVCCPVDLHPPSHPPSSHRAIEIAEIADNPL